MPCYTVSVTPTDRIFVITPDDAIREFKGEHILHPHTQEILVSINAASRNPKTGELEYKISTGNNPIFHLSKKNVEQDRFLKAWTMNEATEEIRLAIYKDVCLTEVSHLATVTSSTIRIQGVTDAMIADLITAALPEDAAYLREQRRILAGGAPADTLTVEGISDIPLLIIPEIKLTADASSFWIDGFMRFHWTHFENMKEHLMGMLADQYGESTGQQLLDAITQYRNAMLTPV